jgi:hypothetical protein
VRQLIHTKPSQPLRWSKEPITFSRADHWVHIPDPRSYPLVVEPIVEGALLPQTLIDGGSGLNVIFVKTLKIMDFDFKRSTTCDEPFFDIVLGKAAYPMGRVSLLVTFGMEYNFCTEYLSFEVADFKSSYHGILGHPMLARFMAIPHYTYLVLKMPAPNGVLTVYCDLIISCKCDNEALDITTTNACIDASTVMVAEAAKVTPTDLTIPEQKRTESTLDATPVTKKVCLSLADPEKTVVISDNLREKQELMLTSFLRDNADIFTWTPSHMLGVPRDLAEHSLDVSKTAKPVKQKLCRFVKDRKVVIKVEIIKLLASRFIRDCKNPVWLVPKKIGQWRMCIDYTDLNRHYPKDPFPLPRIDQVVDSTSGSVLLCFLYCYSGYHYIALKVSDQDKTTFITPHDIYCYTTMTFGLKNTGVTYQKAIQKCLESQIGDNIKVYVDDVVVKTMAEDYLIADLAQTFANLRRYRWKLNPEKCVFGVPSGKLLGFMVSHRDIEANPTKVDAIRRMKRPTGKKDVMKLTDMMAALGCFISKRGEKGLPFFKLLKKSDKFEWTDKAN